MKEDGGREGRQSKTDGIMKKDCGREEYTQEVNTFTPILSLITSTVEELRNTPGVGCTAAEGGSG